MSDVTPNDVMAAVESLRADMHAEMEALRARIATLEARQDDAERERDAEVDPETLVMLAAAVTSYLGRRVRIRSARRVRTGGDGAPAWARHGRAAIQASHHLHRSP
jgi:citrate synthase